MWVWSRRSEVGMPANSDGRAGERGGDSFDFTEIEWDENVIELSEHLDRLWRVAGDERKAVGQLQGVRAGLFGYGRVARRD